MSKNINSLIKHNSVELAGFIDSYKLETGAHPQARLCIINFRVPYKDWKERRRIFAFRIFVFEPTLIDKVLSGELQGKPAIIKGRICPGGFASIEHRVLFEMYEYEEPASIQIPAIVANDIQII